MYIFDHLSTADRELVLLKIAQLTVEQEFAQREKAQVYDGQQALADRLNCSVRTVANIMAEQKIAYMRVGKKGYQFTEQAVVDFLKAA